MAKGNYITQMISQYGDNFIVSITPQDIQNQGKRIVKELVKGKYNFETEGKYFLDPKFLENILIFVSNEYEINVILFNALSEYKNNHPDYPNIGAVHNHINNICYIYSVIHYKLNELKITQNIGSLYDISPMLYNFRNDLN